MEHIGLALAVFSLMALFYFHYLFRGTLNRRVRKVREARLAALAEIEEIKKDQTFRRKLDALHRAVITWKYSELSHADRARLVSIMRRQPGHRRSSG